MKLRPAPSWKTTKWFNSDRPLDIADFRGKVVVVYAFQMLCPACITHGIPQASKAYAMFGGHDVEVVGLHTVFEHHAAMGPTSLEAFLHEFRVEFPVGIDEPSQDGDPRPKTMREYAMQGTPTVVLIDRAGFIKKQVFGIYDDLLLGADIAKLAMEPFSEQSSTYSESSVSKGTDEQEPEKEPAVECLPEGCEITSS